LQAGGARHLIDLYCGVGFFGIEAAGVVESFVGVEYDQLAIKAARQNAAARKITNGEFMSRQSRGGFAGAAENFPRKKRR
jgi:tRNA/tmRNA/rRNA uracil-C5-methylase (TrmA/RlmC/RlmD family)